MPAPFLSTLSLRRATRLGLPGWLRVLISIHALLAESDSMSPNVIATFWAISIHALLAESDYLGAWQSCNVCDFYPRSPCGERHNAHPGTRQPYAISIHALLAESDSRLNPSSAQRNIFLSTLSLRRATQGAQRREQTDQISIHALLAESDALVAIIAAKGDISIHALLAESDAISGINGVIHTVFLSTLSLRRATTETAAIVWRSGDFYPRSPCGERQPAEIGPNLVNNFYPRSPCGERLNPIKPRRFHYHFYPRSPCGERRLWACPAGCVY